MTHLLIQLFASPDELFAMNGMWIFLAAGTIALFGIFLPTATWMDHRRNEGEGYHKAERIR